ncbi:MAG TPA: hypothetical protein VFL90_11560, partial [Methylomirabilota bacterium]|nr:hypothetical protein [Methylomirabilota bacterium]
VVVLAPQVVLVRRATGAWSLTGKQLGYTLTFSEHVGAERSAEAAERLTAQVRPQDAPPGALAYALRSPGALALRALINLHLIDKYTLPGLLQSGGIALVALGLLYLRRRRDPPEWVLLAALMPLLAVLLFNVESRYFLPAIPVLAIIAALGVVRVGRAQPAQAHQPRVPLGAVALLVVLLSFVPWLVRPWFRQDPGAVDEAAGRWLRAAAPGPAFVGRYPVIGYYAGARAIPLAAHTLDEAVADGRRQGARFLVVDSERLPQIRPDLAALLGGTAPGHPELELATTLEDRAGRRVLIYRIVGGAA